jgi:hypothetical protein
MAKQIFDKQGIEFVPVDLALHPEKRAEIPSDLRQLPIINNDGVWTAGWNTSILSGILASRMPATPAAQ